MEDLPELKWKRPSTSEYPKVWHTFKAKDTNNNNLEEYRIEDFTESRSEEALKVLVKHFCGDEPICNSYGVPGDKVAEGDHVIYTWPPIMKQKMALVCYKSGSDEIVGLNMNFVICKDDTFYEDLVKKFKSEKSIKIFKAMSLLNENFDTFEHYGVDKYLSSLGLVVTSNFRGRGIGEEFLKARKAVCKEFGIKLTSTSFSSDFSNRIADKAGFKLDVTLSYEELRKKHPELGMGIVKSKELTLKSIFYPDVKSQ